LDECGTQLFALLEKSCGLNTARSAAMQGLNGVPLRLQFIGEAESLRVPFETLMNPAERKPLAIQHLFTRAILRPGGVCPSIDSRFLSRRAEDGGEVRVLLVGLAEDSEKDVHKVAKELHYVGSWVVLLLRKGIRVVQHTISPSEATLEEIEREMGNRDWDIIHIAGHCPPADRDHVDRGIRFASGVSGEFAVLTPLALEKLIRRKPPAFMFLNCCDGTEVYADVLVNAGVPGFVTFRGQHASEDFVLFAREFYEALAEYGDLETATQLARSRVYESLPASGIWAAASLVLQAL